MSCVLLFFGLSLVGCFVEGRGLGGCALLFLPWFFWRVFVIEICRKILVSGSQCGQPAVGGSELCRHHGGVKKAMERVRRPVAYGAHDPLPLVFPEDRASIQLNLALVMEALNHRKIDTTMANTMNRLLHSCSLNLGRDRQGKGPLVDAEAQDVVRRVILTPAGEEIAPPREVLEEGEILVHGEKCPCRRCAEEHRGAEPEEHHRDCQCGLCGDSPSGQPLRVAAPDGRGSMTGAPIETQLSSRPERSAVEGPAVSHAATNPSVLSVSAVAKKTVSAAELCAEPRGPKSEEKPLGFFDYLYGDPIRKHEAQYAERVRAAREAGIDPPPHEPFNLDNIETEADREERAYQEEIEKNKQVAREIWVRRFGTPPPEPELSWNEKEDLRVAAMKNSF
jgi:hypothetical protein